MKPRCSGLLLSRRSYQGALKELQIWMEKRYSVESTWTGSENITFEKERKKSTRLKTQKDSLGKS